MNPVQSNSASVISLTKFSMISKVPEMFLLVDEFGQKRKNKGLGMAIKIQPAWSEC